MSINIEKIKAGRHFKMTSVTKADQLSKYHINTVVKDGKAYRTMQVVVTFVEDKGEYLYVGFRPSGKDLAPWSSWTFGATRIYKENQKEYGTLGFEPLYNYR